MINEELKGFGSWTEKDIEENRAQFSEFTNYFYECRRWVVKYVWLFVQVLKKGRKGKELLKELSG